MSRPLREYLATLLVLVTGGVLSLVASRLTWGEVQVGSGLTSEVVTVTGGDLVPFATAVGLFGLAAVVAVHATRRRGRWVVGCVLAVAGLAAAVWSSTVARDLESRVARFAGGELGDAAGWPALALLAASGGALVGLAGLVVALRGARWPSMGARYERRPHDAEHEVRTAWDALDRGEDPTA